MRLDSPCRPPRPSSVPHLVDAREEEDAFLVLDGLLPVAHVGVEPSQQQPQDTADRHLQDGDKRVNHRRAPRLLTEEGALRYENDTSNPMSGSDRLRGPPSLRLVGLTTGRPLGSATLTLAMVTSVFRRASFQDLHARRRNCCIQLDALLLRLASGAVSCHGSTHMVSEGLSGARPVEQGQAGTTCLDQGSSGQRVRRRLLRLLMVGVECDDPGLGHLLRFDRPVVLHSEWEEDGPGHH